MNHCIIVNLMGICSGANQDCEHFTVGYEDCLYHINQRCCHAVAIVTATRKDRRSRDELKHLKAGFEP